MPIHVAHEHRTCRLAHARHSLPACREIQAATSTAPSADRARPRRCLMPILPRNVDNEVPAKQACAPGGATSNSVTTVSCVYCLRPRLLTSCSGNASRHYCRINFNICSNAYGVLCTVTCTNWGGHSIPWRQQSRLVMDVRNITSSAQVTEQSLDSTPGKYAVVCHAHFDKDDYKVTTCYGRS